MIATTQPHLPTIVYVEDNAGDAVLLEEALRMQGHESMLLVIDSGDKALRYLQVKETVRDLPPPHCILLDSHLPMVTGAQLLRFIRGSPAFDGTPVYIFTAETEYADLLQAGIVSKESFLTKPMGWDGFLHLADLLMGSAVALQEGVAAYVHDQPEIPAEGDLRRQDTQEQRERIEAGPAPEDA